MPFFLALKAEALHLADRTSEALEAIREAQALARDLKSAGGVPKLHRLRGVFLATLGDDEVQIEASFCEAIRTAKKQKSISLTKLRRIPQSKRKPLGERIGGQTLTHPIACPLAFLSAKANIISEGLGRVAKLFQPCFPTESAAAVWPLEPIEGRDHDGAGVELKN